MFIYSFVFNESYIRIITSKYTFIDTHTGCISRNNRYNEKKNRHHRQQQQHNPRGIHWRGTIAFDRSNGAKMRTQQMHRIYTCIYVYCTWRTAALKVHRRLYILFDIYTPSSVWCVTDVVKSLILKQKNMSSYNAYNVKALVYKWWSFNPRRQSESIKRLLKQIGLGIVKLL